MKNVKLSKAALAVALLLGLVIMAAPSYAGSLEKKHPPKIHASNRAIKLSGTKMNTARPVTAPVAKKPKDGK